MAMNQRERNALDRHITGNYGEDQLRGEQDESLCTCENRSWYGPEHDSACELTGPREKPEATYTINPDACVKLCEAIAAFWGNDDQCDAPIHPGAYLTERDRPIKDLIREAIGWRRP